MRFAHGTGARGRITGLNASVWIVGRTGLTIVRKRVAAGIVGMAKTKKKGSTRYGKLLRRCEHLDDAIQAYRQAGYGLIDVEDAIVDALAHASAGQVLFIAEIVRNLAVRRRRKKIVTEEQVEECTIETDEKPITATR